MVFSPGQERRQQPSFCLFVCLKWKNKSTTTTLLLRLDYGLCVNSLPRCLSGCLIRFWWIWFCLFRLDIEGKKQRKGQLATTPSMKFKLEWSAALRERVTVRLQRTQSFHLCNFRWCVITKTAVLQAGGLSSGCSFTRAKCTDTPSPSSRQTWTLPAEVSYKPLSFFNM